MAGMPRRGCGPPRPRRRTSATRCSCGLRRRALSTRLALVGPAPSWPLPVDLAEGELWHGVDDYELEEAAFTRALATRETALGWRGLARARDRRGNKAGACEAYRRVTQLLAGEPPTAALAIEARGYTLLCVP